MTPRTFMMQLFAAWAISWVVAAWWSAPATARASWGRQRGSRLLTVLGPALLFGMYPHRLTSDPVLWRVGNAAAWGLVVVAVAGLAFAWWARLHLGRLWSGSVTRKAEHRVVDTGPYGLVRHPIYTGIILATVAVAVQRGTPLSLAGVCVMTLGWWLKARLEERFLREQLGRAEYDAYAARVPMLVPGMRGRNRAA